MTTNNSNAGHIHATQVTNNKEVELNLFEDAEFFAKLFGTDVKTILLREYATGESN